MKVQQMFNALPILQRLVELKLPLNKAFAVYNLIKQIESNREFFIKEERKLIEQFNVELLSNGDLKFNSPEEQAKFIQQHTEMMQCELDDLKVVEISLNDLKDECFSAKEIMLLEGVVNFIE